MLKALLRASPNRASLTVDDGKPSIYDFEKSPLRFEYEVLVEEYRALREQINLLTSGQQQVVSFSIALIAALGALGQFVVSGQGEMFEQSTPIIVLIASLTFSAFSLMNFSYDIRIAFSAGYINSVLRPRMEKIIANTQENPPKVWRWEDTNARRIASPRQVLFEAGGVLSRYAITMVPSLVLTIFYGVNRDYAKQASVWEDVLFGMAIVSVLLILISGIYAILVFAKLPSFAGMDD